MKLPPKILLLLLDAICPHDRPDLKGDLLELYHLRCLSSGTKKASIALFSDLLTAIPLRWIITKNLKHLSPKSMLKTNLKIAGRHLFRNKLYTGINIVGLTVSLAACLLISFFIRDEISFDKHFKEHEKIYRVAGNYVQSGNDRIASAATTYMLMPLLAGNVTGMKHVVRADFHTETVIVDGDKRFDREAIAFADSLFLEMFSLNLLSGNSATALDDPSGAVIDRQAALKYFGTTDAVGKTFVINEKPFTVKGVMEEIPKNTHFDVSVILPMSGVHQWYPEWVRTNISGRNLTTYVKVDDNFNQQQFEIQLNKIFTSNWQGEQVPQLFLQGIGAIHLGQKMQGELKATGSETEILIFSITAAIILLLACMNYINLSMAAALPRSKEAGVKRVLGATVRMVGSQFQLESLLVLFVSAVLAALVAWLCMPFLNELSGKELVFDLWKDPQVVIGLSSIVIVVGLIAGSFPALTLVRAGTIRMLSGKIEFKHNRFKLSDILVVFQFAVAVGLIASTLIIMDQIQYIRNRNIGVNTEQLVLVPLVTPDNASKYEVLRTELLKFPYIKSVTASTNKVTGGVFGWRGYIVDPAKGAVNIPTVSVAHDFFETMEASMVDGRSFSRDFPADSSQSYIINEAAAKLLGLEKPVGSFMFGYAFNGQNWSEVNAHIIGVVKDFHFSSLHSKVEPVVFSLSSSMTPSLNWMEIRISGEHMNEATASMEKVWSTIIHEQPFEFTFMEDEIQRYYVAEEQFMKLFISFSSLSLFIGVLGLFGLTAYMAKRRTREIGIRKVVGASTTALVTLMSRDFLKLVLIASVIGAPVSWYFMDEWLHHFAFQTSITLATFFITGLTAMLVAFLAVLYHALHVSRSNPVNALRME